MSELNKRKAGALLRREIQEYRNSLVLTPLVLLSTMIPISELMFNDLGSRLYELTRMCSRSTTATLACMPA